MPHRTIGAAAREILQFLLFCDAKSRFRIFTVADWEELGQGGEVIWGNHYLGVRQAYGINQKLNFFQLITFNVYTYE